MVELPPSLRASAEGRSEPLNEICTLFGFYCRFGAYLVAVALAVASGVHAHLVGQALAAYGALSACLVLALEASWCCFHHRCCISKATLFCDSYALRAGVYAVVGAGGALRCANAVPAAPTDLLVLYIALGCTGGLFLFAHWERPPSIFAFYLAEQRRKKLLSELVAEDKGSDKSLLECRQGSVGGPVSV